MSDRSGWLEDLVGAITRRLLAVDILPPLGCHVVDVGDCHEVSLFFGATEIYGGLSDGQQKLARFYFDLRELEDLFDSVTSMYWQPLAMADDDEVGPHLGLEGTYRGNNVWLRVLAEPPKHIEHARIADVYERQFVETW